MDSYYSTLPEPPEDISAPTILARFVDSIAFRYYWCLHGLPADFYNFQPSHDTKSAGALLKHIYELSSKIHQCFIGDPNPFNQAWNLHEIKNQNLDLFKNLSKALLNSDKDTIKACQIYHKRTGTYLSFWNLINGPLTDILTHIGQINNWRRMAGYPPSKMDMIGGKPVT